MAQTEPFLSTEAESEIVAAIREAERETSGEIRVHLEKTHNGDTFLRAQEVFFQLKMDRTRERNGVLLYIAVEAKSFVILGDSGIDKVVPNNFWDTTRDVIEQHFRKGDFKLGIIAGILSAGQELKAHFPWRSDDQNELSDAISKN
jgi:uncharacterized membrane protein